MFEKIKNVLGLSKGESDEKQKADKKNDNQNKKESIMSEKEEEKEIVENVASKDEVVEEKDDKKAEETTDGEEKTEEKTNDVVVEETEPTGNGIALDDIVTKEILTERLSAFEAKFDAILKENQDLKNTVSSLKDKYENKNFGSSAVINFEISNDSSSYESFDDYINKFK